MGSAAGRRSRPSFGLTEVRNDQAPRGTEPLPRCRMDEPLDSRLDCGVGRLLGLQRRAERQRQEHKTRDESVHGCHDHYAAPIVAPARGIDVSGALTAEPHHARARGPQRPSTYILPGSCVA